MLAIGVALIVLPGPAVLVIPAGLAILATEFAWARRCLDKSNHYLKRAKARAFNRGGAKSTGEGQGKSLAKNELTKE